MLKLIEGVKSPDGTWKSDNANTILHHVQKLIDFIPDINSERFIFDDLMIKAISNEWKAIPDRSSDAIIPVYGEEWSFRRELLFPGGANQPNQHLELLFIHGSNDIHNVDLSEYSWMVHELAHSLFYRNEVAVCSAIEHSFQHVFQNLRIGALSDRGAARTRKQRIAEQIIAYWSPTDDHHNWAHELMIDMLGVAVAGPAYGRSFLEATSMDDICPYHMEQSHPPFAVRCHAIAQASGRFGWDRVETLLDARAERWASGVGFGSRDNAYRAITDQQFIRAAQAAAFDVISELQLSVCSIDCVRRVEEKLATNRLPELGIEMLLSAWIATDSMNDNDLRSWTENTVRRVIE